MNDLSIAALVIGAIAIICYIIMILSGKNDKSVTPLPGLVECPTCFKHISKRASACLGCGSDIPISCRVCKKSVHRNSSSCPECGDPEPFGRCGEELHASLPELEPYVEISSPTQTLCSGGEPTSHYSGTSPVGAGFWKRVGATLVDSLITSPALFIVGWLIGLSFAADGEASIGKAVLLSWGVSVLFSWFYHALFESSDIQATPGKMAIGIKVTDLAGNRIDFGTATGRHFGKVLSIMLLGIGFLMVAFTDKKQGLHDKMADCLVVNK